MNLAESTQSNLVKLCENPKISQLLEEVKSWGKAAVFGGAVRDWSFGNQPRDIDVVVDCPSQALDALIKYKAKKNRFGGYKLTLDKVEFDIWNLDSTWAFGNDPKFSKKLETIPQTVFLNVDAVAYCLDDKAILDKGFTKAMESRVLDIVYEPNPYPYLCVSKSLVALKKYDMKASPRLRSFIRDQEGRGYTAKSFNVYQKVQYGDTVLDYTDCMNRV
jgi:hypothetical protein